MSLSELYTIPVYIDGAGPVHVVSGSLTASSDATVYTPAADNYAFLVGHFFSETSADNITYKSGSTTIVTPECAANQGILSPISRQIILAGDKGQALKVNPSADITSAVFHVIEAPRINM